MVKKFDISIKKSPFGITILLREYTIKNLHVVYGFILEHQCDVLIYVLSIHKFDATSVYKL